MQETLRCFISYAHTNPDDSFAQKLYSALYEWGFEAWLDIHNIPAGISEESAGWIESIDKGLRSSQVLIGLISPTSLQRPNVQREWKWALINNLRIFLIRLEDFNTRDMSHQFVEAIYIDKDNIEKLNSSLDELFHEREIALPNYTKTNSQFGSLNTEILADLEELARLSPSHSRDASGKKDKLIGSVVPSPNDAIQLRDRVRRYWLEGILRPSLEESLALNINLTVQEDAVIQHETLGNLELKGSMDVHKAYKELKNFLILGEAGAGKTVMLLQLATKLLRHEKHDIPLVLNLSSWGNDAIPLEEWLIKEAETTYQIRAATFQRWLNDKQLILLLDGLDEIKEEVRAERIQRINAFRQSNPRIPIVLCSRIAEYRLTTQGSDKKKLNFPHALRLEALSREQVEAYLDLPEFAVVKALYEKDEIVQDLAQIPFLLTSMAYTYKGEGLKQLEIKENNYRFSRTKHLFERYISLKLKSHAPLKYSEEKVREYLKWIAMKTSVYGNVFRPDEITIGWFEDDKKLWKTYQFWKPKFEKISLLKIVTPYITRWFLKKKLPSPISSFISEMVERQIMRPMGGGHLFRHDYLLQSLSEESLITASQILVIVRDFSIHNKEVTLNMLQRFGNLVDLMPTALNHEDYWIRLKAVELLDAIDDPRAFEPLIGSLKILDYETVEVPFVYALLDALIKKEAQAVEPLISALKGQDEWIRKSIVKTLVKLGLHSVEPLIVALRDEDSEIRFDAVEALRQINDARIIEPLINTLKDKHKEVRRRTAWALGLLGDIRAVEPLINSLKDKHKEVRWNAVEALRKIGDIRAVEPLIVALTDTEPRVRENAAKALGQLGDIRAVEPLIVALTDTEPRVRENAIDALHKLRDKRSVESLILNLQDEDFVIQRKVADALYTIGTPEALQALKNAGYEID